MEGLIQGTKRRPGWQRTRLEQLLVDWWLGKLRTAPIPWGEWFRQDRQFPGSAALISRGSGATSHEKTTGGTGNRWQGGRTADWAPRAGQLDFGAQCPRDRETRTGTSTGCIMPPPPLSSSELVVSQKARPNNARTLEASSSSAIDRAQSAHNLARNHGLAVTDAAIGSIQPDARPPWRVTSSRCAPSGPRPLGS